MLMKLFDLIRGDRDETIYDTVDRLNRDSRGGSPITDEQAQLGVLDVPSRSLMLEDPQLVPDGLVVRRFASARATIIAELWRYPNGAATVKSIHMTCGDAKSPCRLMDMGGIGD